MSEEWAEKLVHKINARDERQRTEQEAFVLREKLKRENGPHLWRELREAVRAKTEVLNRLAERDVFVPEMASFNNIGCGQRKIAEFDRERLILTCYFGGVPERFRLEVDQNGEVRFGSKTVEQVASRLIETNC